MKDAVRSGSGKVNQDRHLSSAQIPMVLTICGRLAQKNLLNRISISESLLNHNKLNAFLKRIVIRDEKLVTYNIYKNSLGQSQRSALNCRQSEFDGQKSFTVCLVGL